MIYTKKIIAGTLIVLILLSSYPQKAQAQYVDIAQSIKEFVLDVIAYNLVNSMLRIITAQTVNWINSGFQGSPAFVRNPQQFFLNEADRAASRLLSSGKLNAVCSPFRAQVRLALVKNYLSEDDNFVCSLGVLANNYDQFMGDFSQGGWGGWFEVTQNDQNNPYGALNSAQNQLAIDVGNQQDKFQDQLNWSGGFLSWETCPEGMELDPSFGTGDCQVDKQTNTPGSVISESLHLNVGIGTRRLEVADEINEIIGALFNQLAGRIVGGVGRGLFGASNPGTGETKYTEDLEAEQDQPPGEAPGAPPPPPCPSNQGYVCDDDNTGGGGGGGTGTGSGAWNIVGTLDPASVTIVGPAPQITSMVQSTDITGGNWGGAWNVDYTLEGAWPQCAPFGNNEPILHTLWAFVNINGQWYGSAFVRNWTGGTNDGGPGDPKIQLPTNWWYDSRWAPMTGHRPVSGEQVGFMVSNGNQRLTDGTPCGNNERSNIVLVQMP
ncbi:MAG: hypothetical protein WAX44_01945 [Minisyncoccia bacterium]